MNDLDKHILKIINEELNKKGAYNIRKDGKLKDREPFHAGLLETFDKLILLAVEFLKSEKDDNA